MPYTIKYQSDSKDGPEFQKISQAQGWVEYLNAIGQVYYFPQLDRQYYESRRQHLVSRLREYLDDNNKTDYLGWIHHLAHQRLIDKFVLPIFGSLDSENSPHVIQCGNSRVDACVMCGIPSDQIPMIAFTKDRVEGQGELLHSTQQFNEIFNLDKVDYRITFEESESQEINFVNSILRHTLYESPPEAVTYYSADTFDCRAFWKLFKTDNMQFKLQIHCTKETQSYIAPSDLFKVEYIIKDPNEWELSYGMMLGSFNERLRTKNASQTLQLWLFDVTETVNLELMMPWMLSRHNFYKTQNEKAVVINGFEKSSGMQIIGNWVK
jgi:hypothetical protein